MKTYILYTTSKSKLLAPQVATFASEISKTKGRGEVKVDIVYKRPSWCDRFEDADGDIKPTWEWFQTMFPKGDYDGVIFYMTPALRKAWELTETIGGARNPHQKDYPEFWVCSDLKEKAPKGYPDTLTNFLRIMFHEHAHFDEDLDDKYGNVLAQQSVHDTDYKLKQIHLYHHLVDYRGRALQEAVNKVLSDVIKLVKKYV